MGIYDQPLPPTTCLSQFPFTLALATGKTALTSPKYPKASLPISLHSTFLSPSISSLAVGKHPSRAFPPISAPIPLPLLSSAESKPNRPRVPLYLSLSFSRSCCETHGHGWDHLELRSNPYHWCTRGQPSKSSHNILRLSSGWAPSSTQPWLSAEPTAATASNPDEWASQSHSLP